MAETRRLVEMTLEQAITFSAFSVAAAGTPGPSNVLLAATGANAGVLRGLPSLLGTAVGAASMMFIVAFGLGSVILDHPFVFQGIKWSGAVVLWWLAWRVATARRAGAATGGKPVGLIGMAAFQWVNPKAWLVCAGAAAAFLHKGAGSALGQSAALGLLFFFAALPSLLPWLACGAVLQRVLRSERVFRLFNVAMGALLAASVTLFIA